MMNIYDKAKNLRNQYMNDVDSTVKLSILIQLLSATFLNKDRIPKIIAFKIDCKMCKSMIKTFEPDLADIIQQVLSDLDLGGFNFNNYRRCSAFTYMVEINFFQQIIDE